MPIIISHAFKALLRYEINYRQEERAHTNNYHGTATTNVFLRTYCGVKEYGLKADVRFPDE
jgi:hypothetical protein